MIKIPGQPALGILLLLSAPAYSQSLKEAGKKVDSLFASYNRQTPGAAVAIVKDGKVVFIKGYGTADLENDKPITPQTVFNIASVSKQFTAFAIYLLVDQGKLSFDDDIRKYIPELPGYGTPIKIRHLLAHTSGLRDQAALLTLAGWRMDDVQTTEQVLKMLARQKALNYTPGTTFNYCNSGYTVLAEIVHRVSGKTFAAYTEENIFKPLGMTSTLFEDNHEQVVKNRARSYERVNNQYYHKPINNSNPGPSNLLTTVEDLVKWTLNFENPVVGNSKLVQAFNEPSYYDNGRKVVLRVLGEGDTIFHAKGQNLSVYKGVNMLTHGGHAGGFRTFMGRFPGQRLSIIALSNDEHNERLGARWQIADLYIKDQLHEEPETNHMPGNANRPATTPTNYTVSLQDFEGEYYSDELATTYTFGVKKDTLLMKHIRLDELALKRTGENRFAGSGAHTFLLDMEFLRNEAGAVTGLLVSNFGVKNLKLVKVK